MMCICILSTNLSISVYVSDKVHLRSGSISNLFLFYFHIEKSEKVLSHRYVLAKVHKYLIIKLKKIWIFSQISKNVLVPLFQIRALHQYHFASL